jgi:hypothetical protein
MSEFAFDQHHQTVPSSDIERSIDGMSLLSDPRVREFTRIFRQNLEALERAEAEAPPDDRPAMTSDTILNRTLGRTSFHR